MLVDVVQINAAVGLNVLRKAVQFACGNTLVCETIKEAKSVAFDRAERYKVRFCKTEIQHPFLTRNGHFEWHVCVSSRLCPWMGLCFQSQGQSQEGPVIYATKLVAGMRKLWWS